MSNVHGSDSLSDWLATPQGQYLLKWEQARFDLMVTNIFGYNAVQIGLPDHQFLGASRISHRFVGAPCGDAQVLTVPYTLPFATSSLDLVLLPHVLEFSHHPHEVLREVERVLVPDGSVIVTGFNPFSLFGVRRALARNKDKPPWSGHYFSVMRIRDWLALLSFETQNGCFGCYAPPMRSEKWIERWAWMDRAGDRWWPVCGGAYMLHGVKRVHSMRLIMPKWRTKAAAKKGLSPIAGRDREVAKTHKTDYKTD
jgi:SAM-dependent methyltransferase